MKRIFYFPTLRGSDVLLSDQWRLMGRPTGRAATMKGKELNRGTVVC